MPEIKKENTKPIIEVYDPNKDVAQKFDFYIKIVIGILVVAMITMLIMVGTLVIDSFHINSAIYKEYSDKLDNQSILLETNKILLEQDKQNQQLIIELQKQILEVLQKK